MEEGVQETKIGKRANFTGKWGFYLLIINTELIINSDLKSVQPFVTPGTVPKFGNKGEFVGAITMLHYTV